MTSVDQEANFVLLNDFIPDAAYDIKYFSNYNFVGERIDGYMGNFALLTKEAAIALKSVRSEFASKGLSLKIFDAYRPQMAVNHFIKWSQNLSDIRMKEFFYPNIDKLSLFIEGYITKKSSHSRGSTVDLTLVDVASGKELDMGGDFDFFGEISHFDYSGLTAEQHANRILLRDYMIKNGFLTLDKEWWHFTLKNEPFPDTYFDFPVDRIQS